MSWQAHDDNCEGCRPAVLDCQTGQKLPADHPVMVAINAVWEGTTLQERRAWHRFTCKGSRMPSDMRLVGAFAEKIYAAIAATDRPAGSTAGQ